MATRPKTKVYVLRTKGTLGVLELLPPDGTAISGKNKIVVYYSPIYKGITVVTRMDEDVAFWRKLRLACGEYNMYNGTMYNLLKRNNVSDQRKARYKVRNSELQALFLHIEKAIAKCAQKSKGGHKP